MSKLTVLTLVTKSYVDLLQEFFLDTLPKEIDSLKVLYVNDFDNSRYNSVAKYLEKKRLELITNEVRQNQGGKLLFIDADVVFAKGAKVVDEVSTMLDSYDLLFQFNDGWYNFGVFAVNCNPATLEFFTHFLDKEIDQVQHFDWMHDQHLMNVLLGVDLKNILTPQETPRTRRVFTNLRHTTLPLSYYANHFRDYKFPNRVPEKLTLFHATNTYSMDEKLSVMRYFKRKHSI